MKKHIELLYEDRSELVKIQLNCDDDILLIQGDDRILIPAALGVEFVRELEKFVENEL